MSDMSTPHTPDLDSLRETLETAEAAYQKFNQEAPSPLSEEALTIQDGLAKAALSASIAYHEAGGSRSLELPEDDQVEDAAPAEIAEPVTPTQPVEAADIPLDAEVLRKANLKGVEDSRQAALAARRSGFLERRASQENTT